LSSVFVKCKDQFWVFYTGRGVPWYHSKDLVTWEPGPPVFQEWAANAVPAKHDAIYWAPDVMPIGNRYFPC
jgi:arabinan endo-1,5-alpha-L-arabinosidase